MRVAGTKHALLVNLVLGQESMWDGILENQSVKHGHTLESVHQIAMAPFGADTVSGQKTAGGEQD